MEAIIITQPINQSIQSFSTEIGEKFEIKGLNNEMPMTKSVRLKPILFLAQSNFFIFSLLENIWKKVNKYIKTSG